MENLSEEELKTKESYLLPLITQAFTEKSY